MRRVVGLLVMLLAAVSGAAPAEATVSPPDCFDLPATIFGQSGAITGTAGNDVIVGSDGPDTIRAGGGDDIVCGGEGDDVIKGGDGVDFLFGDEGDDVMSGESGNDLLEGEDTIQGLCLSAGTDDRLDGGQGDDVLLDYCGVNQAKGGPGHDLGAISGTFDAGSGDDNVSTSDLPSSQPVTITISVFPPVTAYDTCSGCGNGRAIGGAGNDSVLVSGGTADGGSGDDEVYATQPGDAVLGGSGSDVLYDFAVGGLRLDGGSAADVCNLNGATTDTVRRCEVVNP